MVTTDDYKKYFYNKRPDIRQRDFGDISERLALREKLHCKSFQWFLDNVFPELSVPDEHYWHGGEVRSSYPRQLLCCCLQGSQALQESVLTPTHMHSYVTQAVICVWTPWDTAPAKRLDSNPVTTWEETRQTNHH